MSSPIARAWLASRPAVPVATLLVAFNVAVLAHATVAGRAYALAFLLVVPGAVALASTSLRPKEASVRVAWSVGASLLLLMLLGLVYSLVLPRVGVSHPLSPGPLVLGIDLGVLGSLGLAMRRGDPLAYLVERGPRPRQLAITAGLAALVLLAACGAERLNNTGSGALATVVLSTIGAFILLLAILAPRVPRWIVGASLYAITGASLLMASMRSNVTFGYDIQSEFRVFSATLNSGAWHVPAHGNPYASMLSITILPSVLTTVTHISGNYVFKLMYPLVFSLFPVIAFALAARFFPVRAALIGSLVVIGQGLYAADITGLARQEIGLVYFALFLVTAFDRSLPPRVRKAGVVVAAVGMAVSHYSTAYFAAIVTIVGFATFAVLRLARSRTARPTAVFTVPVVALVLGTTALWNVWITRSAGNVTNAVSTLESDGLRLVPGPAGTSLLDRFLNADVNPPTSTKGFAATAVSYYADHAPFLHPFPKALTARYPVQSVDVPTTKRPIPASVNQAIDRVVTALNEILLLLISIGVLVLLWRERRARQPVLTELAAFALGCLVLLGLLRLSGTISTLYNAPRGQVQGAPLLGVGLALVCTWLFERRRPLAAVSLGAVSLSTWLLLFWYSGLAEFALGGDPPATLADYGSDYQAYYFTPADMASAEWLIAHVPAGGVTYADTYGTLQILHFAKPSGLITTVIPEVLEPGAYVYATSTNVIFHSDRSTAGNSATVSRFPFAFLDRVDNVVFTTGTTRVYR